MPKGQKKESDFDGWILRMLEHPEDLFTVLDEGEFLAFGRDKIRKQVGYYATAAQDQAIVDHMGDARDLARKISVDPVYYEKLSGYNKYRLRDVDGLYGRRGAFVSPSKVAANFRAAIDNEKVRKETLEQKLTREAERPLSKPGEKGLYD